MNSKRVDYLDGLRGIATVQVALGHFLLAFSPGTFKSLGMLANSAVGVNLLLLVSGLVLTLSFERTANSFAASMAQRVVRLGIPLVVTTIFAFAIQVLPNFSTVASQEIGSAFLANSRVSTDPAVVVAQVTGLTMLTGYDVTTLFGILVPFVPKFAGLADPPSWTLHHTFWGSALVFGLVWARSRSKAWYVGMLSASIVLIGCNRPILFVLGHLSAVIMRTPSFQRLIMKRWVLPAAILLSLTGILICTYHDISGMWRSRQILLALSPFQVYGWFSWPVELGSILIYMAILVLPAVHNLLRWQFLVWLGRMSFSFYLLHWPIMTILGSAVFVAAFGLGQGIAVAAVLAIGLSATLGLAVLFEKWVERPAAELSRAIGRFRIFEIGTIDKPRWLSATGNLPTAQP